MMQHTVNKTRTSGVRDCPYVILLSFGLFLGLFLGLELGLGLGLGSVIGLGLGFRV